MAGTAPPPTIVHRHSPPARHKPAPFRQVILFIFTLVSLVVAGIATMHYNLTHVAEQRSDNLFAVIVDRFKTPPSVKVSGLER